MSKQLAIQLLDEAYDCVESRKYQLAKEKLEKALSYADDIPDIHSEYALVLTFLEDFDKAKIHIEKSIRLARDNPKFWAALSNWQFGQGEYENAMTSITTAEILDPNYPAVYLLKREIGKKLGVSRKELKAYRQKAKELYKEYGKRSDGEPLREGDLEAYFGKERKGFFGFIRSLFGSKKILPSTKKIQIPTPKKEKKRNSDPNVLKELIPMNSRTKYWRRFEKPGVNPSEILKEVERGLKRNPNDGQALHQKSACLIALKRFKEAEKVCKEIFNRGGDNPMDMCNYAICLANNGWLNDAIEMVDFAKKSLPFAKVELGISGQLYFNSALLHFLDGKNTIGKDDYYKSREMGYFDNFNPFE